MRYVVGVLSVLALGCSSEVPTEPAICETDLTIRCERTDVDGDGVFTGIHCRDRASGVICAASDGVCLDGQAYCGDWGDVVCVTMPAAEYREWAATRPRSCD